MSPSTHLVKRKTGTRGTRWQVRFRWRANDSHARYFATFPTQKDAKVAEAWVATEIAHGRYPDPARYFVEPDPGRTVGELHREWDEARAHEVGPSARKMARQALNRYGRLATLEPEAVRVADVRAWVASLSAGDLPLARQTIGAYLSVLRQVLDHADLQHPNPARDARVRLPKKDDVPEDPPSYRHYLLLAEQMATKHAGLLVFLERTGMRISEALRITWGDIDWNGRLLRVKTGKTVKARRWVPLLPEVEAILNEVPVDDRVPDLPVFPGLSANSMRSAMNWACQKAGVPVFTPHDLRHRYTSLLVMGGVPAPLVSRIVGHARISVTLDTYSHVLMDEPADRLGVLRSAAWTVPGARDVAELRCASDQAVTGTPDREAAE